MPSRKQHNTGLKELRAEYKEELQVLLGLPLDTEAYNIQKEVVEDYAQRIQALRDK